VLPPGAAERPLGGAERLPGAAEQPRAAAEIEPDEELDGVEDDDLEAATDRQVSGATELAPGLPTDERRPSVPPGPRTLSVPDGEVVRRVDRFVADRTGLSRSYVQRLISEGRLVDDAGRRLRANSEVRGGSVVLEVPPPEVPYHLEPDPTIEVRVVYEDDDLLIVDKPAGLVVHPAPGHWRGTLVNGLLARGDHYGGIAGVARPGIVHRLDRDTSGLLMVARNDAAQASLMAQLKARRVRKTYLALVQGSVSASVGRIEAPIGRDPKDRKKMAVVPDGRRAVTGYRVRERFRGWTLLELDLVTGRTHQIRVHLAALGHSVAGDSVYGTGTAQRGPDRLDRLFLHAWRLELVSPSSAGLVRAEAPLPESLEAVLDGLRAADASAEGRLPGGSG
jgi:23S rRNA pseudouridine1911/1915/1917 synthase